MVSRVSTSVNTVGPYQVIRCELQTGLPLLLMFVCIHLSRHIDSY